MDFNTPTQETEISEIQHKCPGCGANLKFDINTGMLACPHCGSTKEISSAERVERRVMCESILKEHKPWTEGTVFRCDNCGAKQAMNKRDISKSCAFCGSNAIKGVSDLPGIRPDSVIPFAVNKNTAVERFRKWVKSRWFAPGAFKSQSHLSEQMNPVYAPAWSFSSDTVSRYNGQFGRTIVIQTRNGTQTRIQWYNVSGTINQRYLDFFVQSGDRISNSLFSRLKPFDLKGLQVYRTEFLAGIVAEHYSRGIEECFDQFAQFVKKDLRHRVKSKYNADHVAFLDMQTQYNSRRFNYVLLPLYISNFRYNAKLFNFYINGQTGKIVGQYPKSKGKIFAFVVGVAIVFAALTYAVTTFI